MRPEFKVDTLHFYETEEVDKIVSWLNTTIGNPYPFVDNASYQQFDWDAAGKWCCIAMSNRYSGHPKDQLVDTWWFADKDDALLFALRWA